MKLFVLDTDVLSLWQHAHPKVTENVAAHGSAELAISVITVQANWMVGTLDYHEHVNPSS